MNLKYCHWKHIGKEECPIHVSNGYAVYTTLTMKFFVNLYFDISTEQWLSALQESANSNIFNVYSCRVIDFVNETVQTLAGNGTKGSDYRGGGKGATQARLTIHEK